MSWSPQHTTVWAGHQALAARRQPTHESDAAAKKYLDPANLAIFKAGDFAKSSLGDYSWRSAIAGSTLAARRPGMAQAATTAANSARVTATKVAGSWVLTP